MGRLDDKVAIITGGSRGMGEAHVRKLVKEGAKVVFTDINVSKGEELAREVGENALFLEHDVTDADRWKQVVRETEETFGPVNILVNNAGIVIQNKVEDVPEEEFRKIIDINLIGTLLGMQSVLPSMKKADKGSIINISSTGGLGGDPNMGAYVSSKFAVRGLTKTAAIEFGEYGIRVNSIHPGTIKTPIVANVSDVYVEEVQKRIPLSRMAEPEEVSNLVVYLGSDDSSYSTGSEFIVDGGLTAPF